MLRWAGIFALCAIVGAVGFLAGGYLGLVRVVQGLEEPAIVSTYPTHIYSEPVGGTEGSTRVIGTIFQGQNRRTAPVEEMPPSLLNALVAKEDERFREHGGVDFSGILRALWVDIRAGGAVEGASTITQQYVKNAYLSQDRAISRKVKEALLAIEIERRYEKDEILGNYLNTVYFGNNAYGAEAAAETYFNKSVGNLSISESATLVGLLWSPSSLGSDGEAATAQRNVVLERMFNAGYITRQDYMEALDEPLPEEWPMAPMVETGFTGPALTRDFAELVQAELVEQYGATTVLQGGLSVYTTLNLEDQITAQDTLYGPNGYLSNPEDPDAALVSIEPETGYIRTMIGNRDQNLEFNLVTQAQRQPGSAFKPFALIAALEQGIDPSTTFVSEEKTYKVDVGTGIPQTWEVENFEGEELGRISLREALWQSDNTVFTDLVMNTGGRGLEGGPSAVADVAQRLGITAEFGARPHPSIVLGTQEVSPLEMTAAYATIANEGRRVTPTAIKKVVIYEGQRNEEVLETASPGEGEQVIESEIAREATEIMVGDITNGIVKEAGLSDRVAAGKSGTSENFFDGWFIGYTPQMVTGLWMGFAEGGATLEYLIGPEVRQLGVKDVRLEIWRNYMQSVLQQEPVENFEGVTPPAATTPANTPVNAGTQNPALPYAAPPPGGAASSGAANGGTAPAGAVNAAPGSY